MADYRVAFDDPAELQSIRLFHGHDPEVEFIRTVSEDPQYNGVAFFCPECEQDAFVYSSPNGRS
jgi:hypothetical protein